MTIGSLLNYDYNSNVVQTTDGTTATIIYTMDALSAVDGGGIITFDIVGYDFDNSETASAKIAVRIKSIADTPSIVGNPIHIVPIFTGSSAGLKNCSVNAYIIGTDLVIKAIGAVGRTINWSVTKYPSFSVMDNFSPSVLGDGYVLSWNASSSSWQATNPNGFSTSAGGSNNEIQFNSSGSFDGTSFLTTDGTGLKLTSYIKDADTVSSSGLLRLSNDISKDIISVRNPSNTSDISLLGYFSDSGDGYLVLGSDGSFSNLAKATYITGETGFQFIVNNDAILSGLPNEAFIVHNSNFGIAGGSFRLPSYGGGQGVMYIGQATTTPSTNPIDGVVLYNDSNNELKYKNPDGYTSLIGPDYTENNIAIINTGNTPYYADNSIRMIVLEDTNLDGYFPPNPAVGQILEVFKYRAAASTYTLYGNGNLIEQASAATGSAVSSITVSAGAAGKRYSKFIFIKNKWIELASLSAVP